METDRRNMIGMAIAACVGCCSAVLVLILLGVGVAGLASTLFIGMAGVLVTVAAIVAILAVRRRNRAASTPSPARAPERARIPIYDATAPITCSIGDDEVPERVAMLERMRSELTEIDVSEHGLVLHFPARAHIAHDVHRFAIDEKRCCEFWGFEVSEDADEVTLRWDAPPQARELLEHIEAYLRGDQPVSTLAGLL